KLELEDQCRVLHEALIILGPGGRELARGVDRRRACRIPSAAKAFRALARERRMRPTGNIGTPKQVYGGRIGLTHRRPSAPPPDRPALCRPCPRRPDHRPSCRPSPGLADA